MDKNQFKAVRLKYGRKQNMVGLLVFAAIVIFARDWWKLAALFPVLAYLLDDEKGNL